MRLKRRTDAMLQILVHRLANCEILIAQWVFRLNGTLLVKILLVEQTVWQISSSANITCKHDEEIKIDIVCTRILLYVRNPKYTFDVMLEEKHVLLSRNFTFALQQRLSADRGRIDRPYHVHLMTPNDRGKGHGNGS